MLVGGLQHQQAAAGILRLDGALTGDGAAHRLAEEVPDPLDAGVGPDIAEHPLHRPGLEGDAAGFGKVDDRLALAHLHLVHKPGGFRLHRRDAEVPLVFNDPERPLFRQGPDVVVVGVVKDLIHRTFSFFRCG